MVKNLLRQVEDVAREHPHSRIVAIRALVGQHDATLPELLIITYKSLIQETPLRGTTLRLEAARPEALCEQCGHKLRLAEDECQCGKCGSLRLKFHLGKELVLDSVVFEETSAMNAESDSIVKTLSEVKFLSGIEPAYVERIAGIARLRRFKRNEVMFDEGQCADNLYFIVSGNVLLEVSTAATGCKHILTVGKGEVLGWSSLTDRPQYAARAIVLDPLQVVEVDGTKLRAMCDSEPRFGYEFLRRTVIALAKRLTATWKQLAELYVAHYVTMPVGAAAQNE